MAIEGPATGTVLTRAFNIDCMVAMAEMRDNAFDLAIVDPMYNLPDNYLVPGSSITKDGVKRKRNKQARELSKQDIVDDNYFTELIRVSLNQIFWGCNYFNFKFPTGRLIWDKKNDSSTFSHAEISSCSLIKGTRIFRYLWNGMLQENMKEKEDKIHAFQKPIALYKWLLKNYAKEGDSILDTHLGSGSSRIAAHDMGFDFTGYEIDKDYFEAQEKRFANHIKQGNLFQPNEMY